ncbi:MAG: hypothetical protein HY320_05540 [Armatimonadetes bacterium]|nr:hypothetical protein [Armatimonadota bacterium]
MSMDGVLIWLAGAAFAGAAVAMALALFHAARQVPHAFVAKTGAAGVEPPLAWLYCEEGAPLERRAAWFPLRPGGRTVFGNRPRAPTGDTQFYYLSAYDIARDHLAVFWSPEAGRYSALAGVGGGVRHNNEALPAGALAHLTDGDLLDVGEMTRFRFSLTGPAGSSP